MNIEHSSFTYTLQDLQELRECLKCNDWLFSSALKAFMHGRGLYIIPWLEFAEKIKSDHNFPEAHFRTAGGKMTEL